MAQKRSRAQRVRHKLRQVSGGKPRLSVFKSNRHIYVQVIDDNTGRTLASASTLEIQKSSGVAGAGSLSCFTSKAFASQVGTLIASKALANNVKLVAFDRGAYNYHGRVQALAEAAREGGLVF